MTAAGEVSGALRHARGELTLDRCLVMGIVNRTPDSFYDGGRVGLDESVRFALELVDEGADVLDIGGVSAGPKPEVGVQEELDRVVPLVDALSRETSVPISVESARPAVARAAIEAGAAIVNDVTGLTEVSLATICAETGAGLVLMHGGGQVRGRPRHPRYDDVVAAVVSEWRWQTEVADARGVSPDQLIVDPGLDFGKTVYHSLELMSRLDELTAGPWPVLVAPSRKDIVGESLALPLAERLEGSLALVALAVAGDAAFVRVHDVRASVRVVEMVETVRGRLRPAAPVRGLWD